MADQRFRVERLPRPALLNSGRGGDACAASQSFTQRRSISLQSLEEFKQRNGFVLHATALVTFVGFRNCALWVGGQFRLTVVVVHRV
jgi:hypothetical protein